MLKDFEHLPILYVIVVQIHLIDFKELGLTFYNIFRNMLIFFFEDFQLITYQLQQVNLRQLSLSSNTLRWRTFYKNRKVPKVQSCRCIIRKSMPSLNVTVHLSSQLFFFFFSRVNPCFSCISLFSRWPHSANVQPNSVYIRYNLAQYHSPEYIQGG